MKTAFWASALLLLVSGSLIAQDKAAPKDSPSVTSAKPLVVAGKVSEDGKMLLTDIETEWSVGNAEALKGYEGRLVRVKCYVDTERNKIHILSVKQDNGASYVTARHSDSAFRR
jgi:hypothetical protein